LNAESFDYAWRAIRDTHWDPELGGLDWEGIRDELRPKVERARYMSEARGAMGEMLSRLEQSHFALIPRELYDDLHQPAGGSPRDGATGLDLRVVDGQALVTGVEEDSPAARSGVCPGWLVVATGKTEVESLFEKAAAAHDDPAEQEATLARSLARRLRGAVGDAVVVTFLDGDGRGVEEELTLAEARGHRVQFGNLPPMYVWFESRWLDGNVGYIRFNAFLDVVRVMESFGAEVQSFADARGIIIDLRGNPGGIGGMAMGMAGWFFAEKGHRLGTMITRQGQVDFFVNPRPGAYGGPVAILVDGLSGSTAEIFTGGMQDLGRARIFGSRTAGAALPAHLERLPNGDGFLHAVADYVSTGGDALEGAGVRPDEEIVPSREALLEGRDPVLEAARRWIGETVAWEPNVSDNAGF
jgi:carboxyl-terminal processing protease